MQFNLDQVVSHLQKVRREHGEENYYAALKGLFTDLLTKEGGLKYLEGLLERLGHTTADFESLKATSAPSPPPETKPNPEASARVIEQAIQQGMPNCKTKAHFDLVLQASEALRVYLNAAFGFDRESAEKARQGLNTLLDLAPKVASVTEKLEEHPEATTNRDFVEPPPDPSYEETKQRALLAALETIESTTDLSTWYANMRPSMEGITTQTLRNELFDAIRHKQSNLRSREAN